ncbi:MAG: phosphoglycerate mutase family protein [Candidatus Nanoarchaeia archaeon]
MRHGESIEAEPEQILSKKGKQQAKDVAKRLEQLRITKVYVSSAQRTLETYEVYKKMKPHVPVVISDKLREVYRTLIGGPEREGTPPDRKKKDMQRADAILKEIINDAQEDDAILLFIHGNLIRYIIAHFLQISKVNLWEELEIHDASISLIDITNNKPQVRLINSIEHLGKEEVEEFYNTYSKTEYLS